MIEWLKNLFVNKKIESSIKLENAKKEDIQFILNEIMEGAKKNHFISEYLNPKALPGLNHQLQRTIEYNKMPTTDNELKANIYVLKKNLKTIGFSWLRYHNENKCERYMSSIIQEERGNGNGKYLFQETQKLITADEIYADVFENSTIMRNILLKNDFKESGKNQSGITRLTMKH